MVPCKKFYITTNHKSANHFSHIHGVQVQREKYSVWLYLLTILTYNNFKQYIPKTEV